MWTTVLLGRSLQDVLKLSPLPFFFFFPPPTDILKAHFHKQESLLSFDGF